MIAHGFSFSSIATKAAEQAHNKQNTDPKALRWKQSPLHATSLPLPSLLNSQSTANNRVPAPRSVLEDLQVPHVCGDFGRANPLVVVALEAGDVLAGGGHPGLDLWEERELDSEPLVGGLCVEEGGGGGLEGGDGRENDSRMVVGGSKNLKRNCLQDVVSDVF